MRLAQLGMCSQVNLPPPACSAQSPNALAQLDTDVACHPSSIGLFSE
jgi:hypothetical protein